jgi:hypothetical protein
LLQDIQLDQNQFRSANVAPNKVNEAMLHEIAVDAGLQVAEKDPE